MERIPCASCRSTAQFRETGGPHTPFCTFLCQRKYHGVSGRALTAQQTDNDGTFFDARNVSLWLRSVALYPDVAAVISAMEEPWPTAADLTANVLQPRDTTNLESGGSGAEMYAATYVDGARHVPFLSGDAVVLMKSINSTSSEDYEMRMAVTEARCTMPVYRALSSPSSTPSRSSAHQTSGTPLVPTTSGFLSCSRS